MFAQDGFIWRGSPAAARTSAGASDSARSECARVTPAHRQNHRVRLAIRRKRDRPSNVPSRPRGPKNCPPYARNSTAARTSPARTLNGAALVGAHLAGADLTGTRLSRGADTTRADTTRADLTGADVTGAILTSANLTGIRGLPPGTRRSSTANMPAPSAANTPSRQWPTREVRPQVSSGETPPSQIRLARRGLVPRDG